MASGRSRALPLDRPESFHHHRPPASPKFVYGPKLVRRGQ